MPLEGEEGTLFELYKKYLWNIHTFGNTGCVTFMRYRVQYYITTLDLLQSLRITYNYYCVHACCTMTIYEHSKFTVQLLLNIQKNLHFCVQQQKQYSRKQGLVFLEGFTLMNKPGSGTIFSVNRRNTDI